MARTVAYLSPSIMEDVLQLNLWWKTGYQGLYFGITMDRTLILYRKGLRYFRDIWHLGRNGFWEWEEAKAEFSLAEVYYDF